MKRHRLILLSLLLAIGCCVMAAPLKNMEVRLTQPDGQEIHCFASGDEFYNYLHDADGFTIVTDQGGYYVYATYDAEGNVIPSNYKVGAVKPAEVGLQPYVKISTQEYYARRYEFEKHIKQPAAPKDREINHGVYNNLVVFIRFAGDTYHSTPFSVADSMFNASNYGSVSLHNYYHHASYNQLDLWSYFYPEPDGETILSYEDINPKQYYQPYHAVNNPIGYHEEDRAEREFSLLERAIEYVEDMVSDEIDFDYNDDGLVDNVVFVVKGETGEWNSLLWPHRWSIWDRYVGLGNLQVFDFNFQLEVGGYFTVGTLCHEMSHSLSAPDLYHYSSGIDPVGAWDLMDGTTNPPQQLGAYMKYKYGHWVDDIPDITDQPGIYEIESVGWEGNRRNAYKIRTSNPNQFYVVEYRDNTQLFDNQLPGGGLLVYRIDTRYSGGAGYNGVDVFDEVYLFRPGGDIYNAGNVNQANFCQEVSRTQFDYTTDPKPFLTNGTPDEVFRICDISAKGDRMTFAYRPYSQGDLSEPGPKNLLVNVNRDAHQVELSWDPKEYADGYNVYRDGVSIGSVDETSFTHPYTDADHGYHVYSVASHTGGIMYVLSAFTDEWVILGDYETLHLDLSCDDPIGTKGGEMEVSFSDPAMPKHYYTIYKGTSKHADIYVPVNTEVTFRWLHGFDAESQGIRVKATHNIGYSTATLFDTYSPAPDFVATYTASSDGVGFMPPHRLWAATEGDDVRLHWAVRAENESYSVYRNGKVTLEGVTGNEVLDNTVLRSGTQRYQVAAVNNGYIRFNPEATALALVLNTYCEPPQNLTGTHQNNGDNNLQWTAPQFAGYGLLAYDDNKYEKRFGSNSQKWGIAFEPEQLERFGGQPLTHLEMFDCSAGTYTFNIYSGEKANSSTLIHTQNHEMTSSMEWVRFALDEEVDYDPTQTLWIGVQSSGVSNPIPCCAYVEEDNSCLVIAGGNWKPASFYGVYSSWMLRAYTKPADGVRDFTYRLYWGEEECSDEGMSLCLDNLSATSVTHNCLDNIRYNVTALWNGRETEFSNPVFLGPSVAVPETPVNTLVKVFPNPAKSVLNVEGHDIQQVVLFTVLGQKVLDRSVEGDNVSLGLETLPKGVYLLQVLSEEGCETMRVVKE